MSRPPGSPLNIKSDTGIIATMVSEEMIAQLVKVPQTTIFFSGRPTLQPPVVNTTGRHLHRPGSGLLGAWRYPPLMSHGKAMSFYLPQW